MEEIGSFIGPSGHITAVTMTRNARTIYSAGQDGGVRVWTSQDRVAGKPFEQKRYTSLPGMTAAVRTLMLSPDEQWLAVSTDRGVKLWNCRESKWSANFDLAARRSRGLAFSRDGQYLIAGVGRQLQVFSLATLDALPQVMIAHNAEIETITFDDRSRSVATADIEGMVRVWDWQAPQLMERAVLTGHNESVSTLEFTPDGRTLITGSRDRTIRLWDPMTGQERAALLGHSDNLLAVRLVGDPRQPMTLVSISRDGAVKWWSSGSR